MNFFERLFRLLSLLCLISILYFFPAKSVLSNSSNNWEELASEADKIQYIDINSIRYQKGILSILTKSVDRDSESQPSNFSKVYNMQIDCDKRLYKEEGEKWKSPKGNKLITNSILKSCTY